MDELHQAQICLSRETFDLLAVENGVEDDRSLFPSAVQEEEAFQRLPIFRVAASRILRSRSVRLWMP